MKQNEILEEINRLNGEIDSLSSNVKRLNDAVSILMAHKATKEVFAKEKTDDDTCDTVNINYAISLPNISSWNAEKVDQFNKFKPEESIIYVQKGILGDRTMSIINGKHILFCDEDGWNAEAFNYNLKSTEKQWRLVPCKRDELKAGDVAFCYLQCEESDINYVKEDNSCYCIITEKGIVFWYDNGIIVDNNELNSDYIWYKVVKA